LTQTLRACKIGLLFSSLTNSNLSFWEEIHQMYAMHGLTTIEAAAIWAVFAVAILGLLYAIFLRSQILREDKGTEKMQEVWNAIREGADAYLRKQLRSILPLILFLTAALFLSVYIVPPTPEALERFGNSTPDQVRLIIGIARALAFVMGASFSAENRISCRYDHRHADRWARSPGRDGHLHRLGDCGA
jgi:TRAP-type uncharacterized transport system fused permease subunit